MPPGTKVILRGLHNSSAKRDIYGMIVAVALGGITYHFAINKPRKQRYAEYYNNFDAEKSAERMREAGLLQSMPPALKEEPTKAKK